MNNAELYGNIPMQVLEQLGFPLNYLQLSLEQKDLIDNIFDETAEIYAKNLKMQDEIYHLEDKVADLQHELNNLAGE